MRLFYIYATRKRIIISYNRMKKLHGSLAIASIALVCACGKTTPQQPGNQVGDIRLAGTMLPYLFISGKNLGFNNPILSGQLPS